MISDFYGILFFCSFDKIYSIKTILEIWDSVDIITLLQEPTQRINAIVCIDVGNAYNFYKIDCQPCLSILLGTPTIFYFISWGK